MVSCLGGLKTKHTTLKRTKGLTPKGIREMTDVSFRDIACSYIEKGYSVIAVKDKRPAIGEQWQNLRLNEVLADKFKNNWANCNGLGLILGEVSGLICLDLSLIHI